MLTLAEFMGGGEAKSPANDFTLGLGQGRFNNYRPAGLGGGGTRTITLLDPNRDIFFQSGGPYYFVSNTATAGGTMTFVNEVGGAQVGLVPQDHIGVFSIVGDRPNREWSFMVFNRQLT